LTIQDQIVQTANDYGVDPNLALAVAAKESSFNPNAVGSSGEIGVFQLMPATATSLGVNDPFDPVQNIEGGIMYLQNLLFSYGGDTAKALAAYNAGPGAVASGRIPSSTQSYVTSVMSAAGIGGGGSSTWLLAALGFGAIVFAMGD
jgi:soluble lytic murein transglycosylase-like protein